MERTYSPHYTYTRVRSAPRIKNTRTRYNCVLYLMYVAYTYTDHGLSSTFESDKRTALHVIDT